MDAISPQAPPSGRAGTPTRLTLVTALFDLARREPGSTRPTPSRYLEWGGFVFALDADVVFYVDPELEREVRARREDHGLGARTAVIPTPLEALPAYGLLDRISAARAQHPLINGSEKDTPLHAVVGWSKLELVRRTIRQDVFPATHLAWIDLGLAKVAGVEHVLEDGVFTRPADRIRLLMMRAPAASELADLGHYLSYNWGQLAAGYISGGRDGLVRAAELALDEAHGALELGYAPTDEQLLVLVHHAHPELFSFHYGDYPHILENYCRTRGSVENLLAQLRWCRSGGRWDRARSREIAQHVVDGVAADAFQCDGRLLAEVLEECFIAVYFADYPNQGDARRVVELYHRLTREDAQFRDAFLRNEIRVRTNFSSLTE